MEELRTPRLLLRRWRAEDELRMEHINRDPEVARYLNRPLDEVSVAAFYTSMVEHWQKNGFGPWALESLEPRTRGRFIGLAGLARTPPFLGYAGPDPELGWRLARGAWGRGLATEAAGAACDHAFGALGVQGVVSIIHPANGRSRRVAEKLGMRVAGRIHNPILGLDVDLWRLRAG